MSRKKMSLGFVVYRTFVMSAILEPRTPEGYLAQRHHKAGLFSLKLYCIVRTSFCSLSSWFVWSVVYLWSCFVWPVLFDRAVDVYASGQDSFGPVELDTYTDAFLNHDNGFLSEWFWFLTSCVSSVQLCLEGKVPWAWFLFPPTGHISMDRNRASTEDFLAFIHIDSSFFFPRCEHTVI